VRNHICWTTIQEFCLRDSENYVRLSLKSRYLGRESNLAPPKCESRFLTITSSSPNFPDWFLSFRANGGIWESSVSRPRHSYPNYIYTVFPYVATLVALWATQIRPLQCSMIKQWIMNEDVASSDCSLIFKVVHSICLAGLRKTTIHLSQDRWSCGRDLNRPPPEFNQKP
jgi:hypothetical protein